VGVTVTAIQPRRYVGTAAALAAYRAGRPVVVDQVLLVDGRPAVRVRLPVELPHQRWRPVAAGTAALGVVAVAGWLGYAVLRWALTHAWQLGAVAAVVTLLVAGRGLPSKPGNGRRTR
jgi:hypothetical protein